MTKPAKPSKVIDLGKRMTQAAFGEIVGIGQPAVSDLRSRGVITDGQTAGKWLLSYCQQLREAAAGRGGENPLATERARLAREQADRIARENAADRGELLSAALLESAVADVARQLATKLDALVPQLRVACPELSADALRIVERELAAMRATAADIQLFSTDEDADDAE